MTARLLLRGGLVADAIADSTRRADLLVDGPLIADVRPGLVPGPGCDVIDLADGSVICPGFIDAHVHAEGPLLATGRLDGALAQGVTTLVAGQDGESWIGANQDTARYLNDYFAPVNGRLEPARAVSLADYQAALRGRLGQNVAVLASQGTIRHNVAGLHPGPLEPAQRRAARRELEAALGDGAVGLSSGLDYLPSRFGAVDEVAEIARPLAEAEVAAKVNGLLWPVLSERSGEVIRAVTDLDTASDLSAVFSAVIPESLEASAGLGGSEATLEGLQA